jgi:hypothetical protein
MPFDPSIYDPSLDDEQPSNAFTDFRLSIPGVPPYSARGLNQTLTHASQAAQLRRTVNGNLKDVSFDGFQKYVSVVSGDDQEPPALDGVWPGLEVVVDCVAELAYRTLGGTPQRDVVEGSSRVSGNYTIYRPRLSMRIVGFTEAKDEYGAVVTWSIELEEI